MRFTIKWILFVSAAIIFCLESCSSENYSEEDFQSVKKIDAHVHINSITTAFIDQAAKDNFFLLDINVDAGHYPLDDQEWLARLQAKQEPPRAKYLATFSMSGWDSAGWSRHTISKLSNSFQAGALGIKIWKNIGMVERDSKGQLIMIDNLRFDSVVQFVINQDKTILGHLGEPKNCWLPLDQMTVNNDREYFKSHPEYHMFLHPELPSYEDQINARDRFLERHPELRFVGAHLGSLEWDVDELAKRLDKFPNMAVDMAARIPHLQFQTITGREKIRSFFLKYQDRLIYATDSEMSDDDDPVAAPQKLHDTWVRDWKYFTSDDRMEVNEVNGSFMGLLLPKAVVDKIYYGNAVRWYKIPMVAPPTGNAKPN